MISEFYQDKSILITGCTGFLGKFLLKSYLNFII
jgi:thioester reductase-like protein